LTDKGKLIVPAILLFVVIYYVIPYVHEFAHAAVCAASGYDYQIHIIFTGEARVTICSHGPSNMDLYHAAGGLAGTATAAALAFATRRKLLFIAAFPFLPQQALIAGMETLAYRWYIDDNNAIPAMVASLTTLGLFLALLTLERIKMIKKKERSQTSGNKE
jgi:hypothetical protein